MASASGEERFGADPLWQHAQAHFARGDLKRARDVLGRMRARAPDDVHVHLLAAQIAWQEDRVRDACVHVLDAARAAPADIETLAAVTNVLLEAGENAAARDCLLRMPIADCHNPLLLMQVATLHKQLEQHAESLALLDQAAALGPADPALRYARGRTLIYHGRLAEAETELAASLAAAPDHGTIAVPLVKLRRQTAERNWLPVFESGARNPGIHGDEQAAFEFARYKTLEDLGRYDDAWQALTRGNALMRARLYDETARMPTWLDRFLDARIPAPVDLEPQVVGGPSPIFIIGMPRSGTTLLERMLGNHSQIAVAGELLDFRQQVRWVADTRNTSTDAFIAAIPDLDFAALARRYRAQTQWRAGNKAFYVDKQPPNWLMAGLIHAALPRAPILNLVRDPVDTCFSNWRAYFGNACAYSYDVAAMAGYYNSYRRVMVHWHRAMPGAILDVDYGALVHDPERTLRQVFDFCGIAWEPGCTDLARNTAPSATLSATQVRGELQRDTTGRWRPYAQHLGPLLDALELDTAGRTAVAASGEP